MKQARELGLANPEMRAVTYVIRGSTASDRVWSWVFYLLCLRRDFVYCSLMGRNGSKMWWWRENGSRLGSRFPVGRRAWRIRALVIDFYYMVRPHFVHAQGPKILGSWIRPIVSECGCRRSHVSPLRHVLREFLWFRDNLKYFTSRDKVSAGYF